MDSADGMTFVFVSNYLNHHQIPFCNAMYRELKGNFTFIQTEPMEEERIKMGWQEDSGLSYIRYYEKEPKECQSLIMDSDVVLYGGTDEERYLQPRLRLRRPVLRYSERLYRTGQWKAVSPRGLVKKYKDHVRYRKDKVFLLCAGAYVPSDFHIIRAYPGKMYRWGYFTETKRYDVEELIRQKGYGLESGGQQKKLYILWAARFLPLKHPELAVNTAKYLKDRGIDFRLDMIGGGVAEPEIRADIARFHLEDCVTLTGFKKPREVRSCMEKADIFLATSNRQEGWGAVVNEAMNSGCAVVADHRMGSVPFLIRHGENGLVYEDGKPEQLFQFVERLAKEEALRRKLALNAYATIVRCWNPENAAACLIRLIGELELVSKDKIPQPEAEPVWLPDGPCSPAPVISERQMYGYLTKE